MNPRCGSENLVLVRFVPRPSACWFSAAGGTHDDWDEFDRVMKDERRAAVLVAPERVYGRV